MHIVADFMDQGIQLTIEAQKKTSKLILLLLLLIDQFHNNKMVPFPETVLRC